MPVYQDIVRKYQLPVFFEPWWLDMVSEHWKVLYYHEADQLKAVWVYTMDKKWGFKIIRNPLLTPYTGLYIFDRRLKEEKIISKLFSQLPSYHYLDLMGLPEYHFSKTFEQLGLTVQQRVTYRLPLNADEETLFKNIHPKQRSGIRQAQKTLKIQDAANHIHDFWNFYEHIFKIKKLKNALTGKFFKKIIQTSLQQNAGWIKATTDENNQINAIVFTVFDKKTMYLLLTATNPRAKHNGAVALLIWNAILEAKKRNLQIFDFEGSSDAGIAKFFKSFGGDKKHYTRIFHYASKWWKLKDILMKS